MIYIGLNYVARLIISLAVVTAVISVVLVLPVLKKNKYAQSDINILSNLFISSVFSRNFAFLIIVVLMLTSLVPNEDMLFSLTLIKLYSYVSVGIFVVSTIESFIYAVLSSVRSLKKYFFWVRISSAFSAILGFIILYIFE